MLRIPQSLRGSLPDNGEDWGLCADGQAEAEDEHRVSLNLSMLVTPGANDEADEFEIEAYSMTLHCSFTE